MDHDSHFVSISHRGAITATAAVVTKKSRLQFGSHIIMKKPTSATTTKNRTKHYITITRKKPVRLGQSSVKPFFFFVVVFSSPVRLSAPVSFFFRKLFGH